MLSWKIPLFIFESPKEQWNLVYLQKYYEILLSISIEIYMHSMFFFLTNLLKKQDLQRVPHNRLQGISQPNISSFFFSLTHFLLALGLLKNVADSDKHDARGQLASPLASASVSVIVSFQLGLFLLISCQCPRVASNCFRVVVVVSPPKMQFDDEPYSLTFSL